MECCGRPRPRWSQPAVFGSLWLFDELLERVQTETVRTCVFRHFERKLMAFEEARDLADEHDVEIDTRTTVGDPSREIVAFAEEHGVDQLVIGSHGRSPMSRILLGSVAETVTRRAPVPVTVVR